MTSARSFGARRPARPPVEFNRVQQALVHDYVAEQLRRHIALRLVAPGQALPSERHLAAMFGVGRVTIQQAVQVLEAERLVEVRRGRSGGTFVLQPRDDAQVMEELVTRLLARRAELEELLDYRCLLEPSAARLAAERRRKSDLEPIRRSIESMAATLIEPEYMRFDTQFHIAVARATHNRHLVRSIEEIRLGLNDALSLLPETETWHRRLSGEHESILAAIEERDPEAAESAARLHIMNSDTSVRAVLSVIRRRYTTKQRQA